MFEIDNCPLCKVYDEPLAESEKELLASNHVINHNNPNTLSFNDINQKGSTMTDITSTSDSPVVAALAERDTAIIQRDEARARIAAVEAQIRSLKASLQFDLKEWAEQNLEAGDSDYQELHDLMVSNDLEGLKRTFTVTVRVSYDFEVEVEATDEDAARDEVDDDIHQYASDYVDVSSPDDYEIEATEA